MPPHIEMTEPLMATRSRPDTSPGRSGELHDEQAPKPHGYTFSILGFSWTLTGDKPLSGRQFILASAATVAVNVLGMTLLLSAILVGAVAVAQGMATRPALNPVPNRLDPGAPDRYQPPDPQSQPLQQTPQVSAGDTARPIGEVCQNHFCEHKQ
ncbi:hypothetical protein [Nonomuraea sp. NPDC049400]|uniref:hypothetical protein n=1 Tax=Nonomuraea sp. NPDC049400 TaxID=3364352 RepID=UPI0037BDFD57